MKIFSILWSFKRAYYSNKKILFLILTAIFVGVFVFGMLSFPSQIFACRECPPPPVCEPNPEADLTGQILHLTGMATATNTSELCSYDVGLAVYKKFDENIDNQELFDSNLKVIGPNTSIDLEVELPDCAYQIDLFYGELIESFAGGIRYGDRKLDWEHNNSGGYCLKPYCGDGIVNGPEDCEIDEDCCGQGICVDCMCQVLPPEPLTILAYKVVCETEEDLPNWAIAGTQAGEPSVISSSTAIEYVENSEERCWLELNWDFQWGLGGEAQKQAGDHIGSAPEGTGWNDFDLPTSITTPAEAYIDDIGGVSNIWVRENLKENYIPFANPSGNLQDNVSAEMLCHDDILNFDNYDYIKNPQLGNTYYCVAFNTLISEPPQPYCGDGNLDPGEECEVGHECDCGYTCNLDTCLCEPEYITHTTTTIYAYKVVCESEEDLPNWGNVTSGLSQITATTAIDYIENSSGTCWLADGWEFQWGYDGEAQKQTGDYIGPAPEGTGWNDFASSTGTSTPALAQIIDLEEGISKIWVRENLQEGYISFSNPPGDLQNTSSAEMWCHDDVLNYDNYDYIRNPQPDQTYYCVAFNAPIPEEPGPGPGPFCGDGFISGEEECDDGNNVDGDGCSANCTIEGECESFLRINITYFANYDPPDATNLADMSDNVFVGTYPDPFGQTIVIIPLTTLNRTTPIIDSQASSTQDDVFGLHIQRGEDNEGYFVEISAYGFNHNKTRESIKADIEFLDALMVRVENGLGGSYENPGDGECGIDEGNPQNDRPGNDEYNLAVGQATGTICSITNTHRDRVRIYYQPAEECASFCGDGVLDEGEECEAGQTDICSPDLVCNLQTCLCEEEPIHTTTTIFAYKVVCESEEYLPNWGNGTGTSQITATTAIDYVASSSEKCWLADGWEFQWGYDGEAQKQTGDYIGPAPKGTGWNDFASSTGTSTPALAQIIDLEEGISKIWVRENLQEGYIPFTYPPKDPKEDNVSAEIYCYDDILNYDNYDYIENPEQGETYYCIAFNAPISEEPGSYCGDGVLDEGEECDDGNTEDGDGCSSECVIELPLSPQCTPEDTRACDTGELGICSSGTQICSQEGFWGDCVQNEQPGEEICNNGLDDDCDGDTDYSDSDCIVTFGYYISPPGPICMDLDSDGYNAYALYCSSGIDCDDTNPNVNPGAEEVCDNQIDDDCDGDIDCDDSDCLVDPLCGGTGGPVCTDLDEDGYFTEGGGCGLVDCDDANPNINPGVSEVCNNQIDDDCDGDIDCDDSDCTISSFCVPPGPTPECESGEQQYCDTILLGICSIGTRTCNEAGFWSDCLANYEASFEICDNGLDDDCDGDTDCNDSDCSNAVFCTEGGGEEEEEEEEVGFFGAALTQVGNFFSNLLASVSDAVSRLLGFFTNGKGLCLCLPACFPWWIIFIIFLYSTIKTIGVWEKDNKETRTWLVWTLILLILTVCFLFKIFACLTFWTFIVLVICTYLIHRSLKKKKEEEQTYKLFE